MPSEVSSEGGEYHDEHEYQKKALELGEGDKVLFNDRSRPLTVVGSHMRQTTSPTWRRRGVSKYLTVVELQGNGTVYHLLAHSGNSIAPMLYKESEWDEDKSDKIGQSPVYSRMGARVEKMEVLDDGE